MSYTPSYTKKNFVNGRAPSINANNLNAIEDTLVNLEQFAQNADEAISDNAGAILAEATARTAAIEAEATAREEAITAEQVAREKDNADLKNTLQKVANSNIQTSNDVLDWAMDGNIVSAKFEGYAYKSKNLLDINNVTEYSYASKAFNVSLPSGTYTFSRKDADAIRLRVTYSDDTYVDVLSWVSTENVTFTATKNIKAIQINKNQTIVDLVAMKCQLEVGTMPTAYEPYGIIKPSGVVESRGKNLFNKSTLLVNRNINDSTGAIGNYDGYYVTDKIYVKPNKTYVLNNSRAIYKYGKNDVYLGYQAKGTTNTVITTSSDTEYIRFELSPTTYASVDTLQFEEGTEPTIYEPYKGSSSIELPYIPLGVNNIHDELIVNADGSGKYIKRVKGVDLGELKWAYISGSQPYFQGDVGNDLGEFGIGICSKYGYSPVNSVASQPNKTIRATNAIYVKDSDYSDAETFKNTSLGVEFIYKLATEEVINLTSSEVEQILALKTFADTTYIDADGLHYEIGYAQNSAKAIKELQNIIQNMLNAIGGSAE